MAFIECIYELLGFFLAEVKSKVDKAPSKIVSVEL